MGSGSSVFAVKLATQAAITPGVIDAVTDDNLEDVNPSLFIQHSLPTDCYFIYEETVSPKRSESVNKQTKKDIRTVKLLYRALLKRGFNIINNHNKHPHLENKKLQIINTACVIVFINRNTLDTLSDETQQDGIEIKLALFKKTHNKIINILLDPKLANPKLWIGMHTS